MGEFDFTYILPENFEKRVVQYLLQLANRQLAEAFQHCKYEYEDVGLAYYAGLRGDNWNKRALDFTFEGTDKDISVLKRADKKLKDAIGKALKPSESGFLIRNVVYFDADVSLEDVESPSSNEERLITNYNALGTATFIVAYVNSANFEAFWERYSEHILHYDFPLQIKENFSPLVHPNAATRIASMILTRDGFDFPVYFIALKIS